MTNETLARRLEVGVNLPGIRGVSREIPPELFDAEIERIIPYVLDSPRFDNDDKKIARAIDDEMKYGQVYTIFVVRGNEEYRVDRRERIGKLFEDPVFSESEYRKLILKVSSPRTGGS